MSKRWLGALVMMALILSACASGEISRNDAVAALQTAGTTEVEATCMADTLLALGQLDAADPRLERNVARREALLAARQRCVSVEVLSAGEGTTSFSVEQAGTYDEEEAYDVAPGSSAGTEGDGSQLGGEEERAAAVATLERLGHSPERSSCIVDHLVTLDGSYLFTDPNFGIGLDALEANAMALCAVS